MADFKKTSAIVIGVATMAWMTVPAVAQRPLDAYMFKGSHNSYERGIMRHGNPLPDFFGQRIPFDELVLRYNSWSVEMDLCMKEDGDLVIQHDCDFLTTEFEIEPIVGELFRDPRIFERLTVLDLEFKYDDCCNNWPGTTAERESVVTGMFDAHIPPEMIYTYAEFRDTDGSVWPSLHTLLDRGRRFIITWNRQWPSETVFTSSDSASYSTVFSVAKGDLSGIPDEYSNLPGDRYLLFSYPSNYYDNQQDQWDDSIQKRVNFIKTNAHDEDWTFGSGTYCPVPLYIDPHYEGDDQWGTPRAPYKSFSSGLTRIITIRPIPDEPVRVRLRAGEYNLGEEFRFPIVLSPFRGDVTLTK